MPFTLSAAHRNSKLAPFQLLSSHMWQVAAFLEVQAWVIPKGPTTFSPLRSIFEGEDSVLWGPVSPGDSLRSFLEVPCPAWSSLSSSPALAWCLLALGAPIQAGSSSFPFYWEIL